MKLMIMGVFYAFWDGETMYPLPYTRVLDKCFPYHQKMYGFGGYSDDRNMSEFSVIGEIDQPWDEI